MADEPPSESIVISGDSRHFYELSPQRADQDLADFSDQ
jgi:hypothetical protein